MGEIGISRREFLYDLQYWEVHRIVRGYRRRDILTYQLLRICAYYSCYSMRENKRGLTPQEFLPLPFDDLDDQADTPPISEEEKEDLLALIREHNARHAGK